MKDADFAGVTAPVPPAAPNGTHRAAKKKGAAPQRSAESGARNGERPAPQPMGATFAEIEAGPTDAPIWLIHSALWFQPDRPPLIPVWTGLAIERHNRIPTPDFLHPNNAPPDRPATLDDARDALTPEPRRNLPQSDLAPLGWDARAVCRKKESR